MTDSLSAPAFGSARMRRGNPSVPPAGSWWTAYVQQVAPQISPTSLRILEEDCKFIVERGIFGAGGPGSDRWPPGRSRHGLVMGAVQSGKTMSMLGVAAMALDRGVDAVALLAGTQTGLWLQTYERMMQQLGVGRVGRLSHTALPDAKVLEPDFTRGPVSLLYQVNPVLASRIVSGRQPLIAVIMKNTSHLEHLSLSLHDSIYSRLGDRRRPFHILVVDDEADDSSVDDALAENYYEQFVVQRKETPRRIVDLWESRRSPSGTVHPNLYATYLAYTATPQANFLQSDDNPLAPRDFVVSLRTPGPVGEEGRRSASYRDPVGLNGWYIGGDFFYHLLDDVPLCRPIGEDLDDETLIDALRCYFVASAVRLLRSGTTLRPSRLVDERFATRDEALARMPPVCSMLVHPTSAQSGHFDVARRILAWSGIDVEDPRSDRHLSTLGVLRDLDENPDAWLAYLDDFAHSAEVVTEQFGATGREVADRSDWARVRRLILEEIIPATRVAVINSDPQADLRPEFQPVEEGGGWRAPRDLNTIFVSGNVMSRGVTLEGLLTTVFTRSSTTPFADSQMQMQRWFGYRGAYVDLCRLFVSSAQLELFRDYHANDKALRRDVLSEMERFPQVAPSFSVLQGRTFAATGKLPDLRSGRLFPGPHPFVPLVNPPGIDDPNVRLIAEVLTDSGDQVHVDPRRGVLLLRPWAPHELADLLDRLTYVGLPPSDTAAPWWRSVENHIGLSEADPLYPLYRAPKGWNTARLGRSCPYAIAAYLRTWEACVDREVPAMETTQLPAVKWNLIPSETRRKWFPTFHVGLRFGSGSPVRRGPLSELPYEVVAMRREFTSDRTFKGKWGSRNVTPEGVIVGDEYFDVQMLGGEPVMDNQGARAPGSQGLVLFHLLEREDGSLSATLGLSIPVGGPDHILALRGK